MAIQVNFNSGNPAFTPSALQKTVTGPTPPLVDLTDVNKTGLNDNDVLVFDAATGKFVPIDKEVINDNDGGVF